MAYERAYFSKLNNENLKDSVCVLGVSVIGQNRYKGKSFSAVQKLLHNTAFSKRIILVGDAVQRFNLAMEYGMEPDALFSIATRYGDEWLHEHADELKGCQIVRYATFLRTGVCNANYVFLKDLYRTDEQFHAEVDKTASDYLRRYTKKSGALNVTIERAHELSVQFFIEELAVILTLLIKENVTYFAYPSKILAAFDTAKEKLFKENSLMAHNVEWLRIRFGKQHSAVKSEEPTIFSTNMEIIDNLPTTPPTEINFAGSFSQTNAQKIKEGKIVNGSLSFSPEEIAMDFFQETTSAIIQKKIPQDVVPTLGAFWGAFFREMRKSPTEISPPLSPRLSAEPGKVS